MAHIHSWIHVSLVETYHVCKLDHDRRWLPNVRVIDWNTHMAYVMHRISSVRGRPVTSAPKNFEFCGRFSQFLNSNTDIYCIMIFAQHHSDQHWCQKVSVTRFSCKCFEFLMMALNHVRSGTHQLFCRSPSYEQCTLYAMTFVD